MDSVGLYYTQGLIAHFRCNPMNKAKNINKTINEKFVKTMNCRYIILSKSAMKKCIKCIDPGSLEYITVLNM